jgi:hypothetical protein
MEFLQIGGAIMRHRGAAAEVNNFYKGRRWMGDSGPRGGDREPSPYHGLGADAPGASLRARPALGGGGCKNRPRTGSSADSGCSALPHGV